MMQPLKILSFHHISFGLLILAIVYIPLYQGGMLEPASLVFSLLIIASLATHVVSQKNVVFSKLEFQKAYLPWLVVLLTVTGWMSIQLFILPNWLSWKLFLPDSQNDFFDQRQPANLLQSLHYWALFCAYWSLAMLASKLSFRQIIILFWVIFGCFAFQVISGLLVQKGFQAYWFLGQWQINIHGRLSSGTFVSHNHYAGFLEVTWPLVASIILLSQKVFGVRVSKSARWLLITTITTFFAMAVYYSGSRMGMAVALFTVTVWFWLIIKHLWKLSLPIQLFIIFCALLTLLIIEIYSGAGLIHLFYLTVTGQRPADARGEILFSVLQFPTMAWIWGVGAGAFSDVYQVVHLPKFHQMIREAHNDYVQFVIEFGIVGTILTLGAIYYWFRKLRIEYYALLKIGALCSIIAIALHSTVDFNLQIPGTAAFFWFALGCFMNHNLRPPRKIRYRKKTRRASTKSQGNQSKIYTNSSDA